jgi:hypothetical protein
LTGVWGVRWRGVRGVVGFVSDVCRNSARDAISVLLPRRSGHAGREGRKTADIILGSTKREEHPQLLEQGPPRGTPLFVDPSSFGRINRASKSRTREQHAAAAAAGC